MKTATIHYAPGWLERVTPGKAVIMKKGTTAKDQLSRPSVMQMGNWHTPEEVGNRFRYSAEYVRDLCNVGEEIPGTDQRRKLGCIRTGPQGRRILISDAHIEEFFGAKIQG